MSETNITLTGDLSKLVGPIKAQLDRIESKLDALKPVPIPVPEPEPNPIPEPEKPEAKIFEIIHKLDLEKAELGPYGKEEQEKDWPSIPHSNSNDRIEVAMMDGKKVLKHIYPKGSTEGANGADFAGMIDNEEDETYFTYDVTYEEGFDFYISNKLPGFRMWPPIKAGYASTAAKRADLGSIIYLQADQQGVMNWNVYHHKMSQDFGVRVGDKWNFHKIVPGQRMEITQRVVLNTPGIADGILQVWVNGELKNTATGMLLRTKTSPQHLNSHAIISSMDWDVPVRRNQSAYHGNYMTWRYTKEYLDANPEVARGLQPHASNHKLITPN